MHPHRHLLGAFGAMLFVGASWGANVPVTKVMLSYFDLMPMAALRTIAAATTLGAMLWLAEGGRALRVTIAVGRFLLLGLMAASFFALYALGLRYSNPITAAAVQVAGPLVSAATVRMVTGLRFDPGFGVALGLTLLGGLILAASSLSGAGHLTFGGGEIVVLGTNVVWTLYSIKAQAWFAVGVSQLHRAYVASVSAAGWLILWGLAAVALLGAHSPFGVSDGWVWTQLIGVAGLASGMGSYAWNIGVSRLGVAIASLWVNLVPFFAVLWSMAYGFMPNIYQIAGGLVALSGVVYMQWRKLQAGRASARVPA
jgi:drug/metabolite transporter (DMT)-like permease